MKWLPRTRSRGGSNAPSYTTRHVRRDRIATKDTLTLEKIKSPESTSPELRKQRKALIDAPKLPSRKRSAPWEVDRFIEELTQFLASERGRRAWATREQAAKQIRELLHFGDIEFSGDEWQEFY